MKIAVIGATRGVGLALTQQAIADGQEVTALVRDPSRMTISNPDLHVIEGDAVNPDSIAKVVEGQDVVCDCLGTARLTQTITMFSRCAENLSKVIKSQQLLIAVTGLGAGDSKGHCSILYDHFFLPVVLRRIYADKDRQEDIIKNNIARWIIVRPGFLNNGSQTRNYQVLTDLKGIHGGRISRADVADFLFSQAKLPKFIGQTPMLIY
ncbi:MAG: flavin reductase [Bacteroidales bacterium]|nr:MAG: flavin reductase [Bacteroidales bacterium]